MSLTSSSLISVSIVSHGQLGMVINLLSDIEKFCLSTPLEVVLTVNIEEVNNLDVNQYSYPIKTIKNDLAKGFGANHNQAFKAASGVYFCVLNPDVRLKSNPFPTLVDVLQSSAAGVCAPLVVNNDGQLEESARKFPSPIRIFKKVVGSKKASDYQIGDELLFPNWVGGMFMLFRSTVYKQMHGFDERYFLYYEDVDICARLTNLGMQVVLCPTSKVVHLAQRTSHKSLKYLRWHISSMLRFFMTPAYWHLL